MERWSCGGYAVQDSDTLELCLVLAAPLTLLRPLCPTFARLLVSYKTLARRFIVSERHACFSACSYKINHVHTCYTLCQRSCRSNTSTRPVPRRNRRCKQLKH